MIPQFSEESNMSGSSKFFYVSTEIQHLAEILKGKLYFGVTFSPKPDRIKNSAENFYFNIDDELTYLNYYFDFGPLNISCLFKYCVKLQTYIECPEINRVVHYTSSNPLKRVNAAFLIGSFAVIYLSLEPKIVLHKLLDSGGKFKQFVDASQGNSGYTIRLLDCLLGIQKAHSLNFFNFYDFNVAEYDLYDKIQNGDFNWMVPRKFIALIGPIDKSVSSTGHAPHFYIKYFLKNDVRTVIRLNNKLYDPFPFEQAGIDHYDLFFPDGTTPPKQILLRFLEIVEKCPGAVAVHCKAGLGRTGCLIGAYIMKHFKFSAREAIAWMRICRPGCVIGQQQAWLERVESWLWKQGIIYRLKQYGDGDQVPPHKYGIYSKEWHIQRRKMLILAHKKAQYSSDLYSTPFNLDNIKVNKVHFDDSGEVNNNPKPVRDKLPIKTQGDCLNEIKMRNYLRLKQIDKCNKTTATSPLENQTKRDANQWNLKGCTSYRDI